MALPQILDNLCNSRPEGNHSYIHSGNSKSYKIEVFQQYGRIGHVGRKAVTKTNFYPPNYLLTSYNSPILSGTYIINSIEFLSTNYVIISGAYNFKKLSRLDRLDGFHLM